MNLRRQIFLRIAALVLLVALSLTALSSFFAMRAYRADITTSETACIRSLADRLERRVRRGDWSKITRILASSVEKNAFRSYAYVTLGGKVLAWAFPTGVPGTLPARTVNGTAEVPPRILSHGQGDQVFRNVSAPIAGTRALLYVGLNLAAIDRAARPLVARLGLVGFAGLLLGLGLAGFAAKRASHEVAALAKALTGTMGDPALGPLPPPDSASEVTMLVDLFNRQMKERRETADALAHQKNLLDNLLDALTHPFYVIDVNDYSISVANRAALKRGIRGGRHCYEVTHGRTTPCEGGIHPCPLELLRATGKPTVIEHEHITPEGEMRFLEIHAYPLLDDTGAVAHMIEYTLDVTERKKAEKELRESQVRYKQLYSMARLMADNLPDMVWAKDLEGRYLFANRALCDQFLFASDTEEPIGKTDVHFADRERARHPGDTQWHTFGPLPTDSDTVVIETRQPGQFEESGFLRGQYYSFDVHKAPLFDKSGRIIGTVGSARDVTRERTLDEERRRLQTAIEQADMGVVVIDTRGIVVYANPAYGRITGYTPEEIVGHTADLIRSQYDDPEVFDEIQRSVLAGSIWRGRVRNRQKDGASYLQGQTVAPVRAPDGSITHLVSYLQDVTDRVELEARYLQAQKLESVGRLAGGIAHDFNNLLGAIRAYAELLQMELDPDDTVHEDVEEILGATEAGARLTRQLLAFAQRQPTTPRPLDLNRVVSDFEGMLGQLIGEDVTFVTHLETGLPPVLADPAQIEQVLANLVVNARDAMPGGGRVSIVTRALDGAGADGAASPGPGHWVILSVSDTGVGMTKEVLEHLFEPFFTTKEPGKGTGLGLSTCFGIVSEAGGRIVVESEPESGTTMTVYLPRAEEEPLPETNAPVVPEMSGGHETILFVEDETKLRRAVAKELRALGYTIIEAASGVQALELWRGNAKSIDLLVTDEVMPHMAGSELARRLRELAPGLRVILVSGYIGETTEFCPGLSSGGVIVSKPFSLSTIATAIRHVLDSAEDGSLEVS